MSCYFSFIDKEVFEGVIPLEGTPTSPVEEPQPPSESATPATAPKESTARGIPQELTIERRCLKFPGWEKVLHLSQLVAVAGQPPCPSRRPEWTYPLEAIHNQPIDVAPLEPTSPSQEPEVAHPTPGSWK